MLKDKIVTIVNTIAKILIAQVICQGIAAFVYLIFGLYTIDAAMGG